MALVRLTQDNWSRYKADVAAIEACAQYPLGNDFFHIDHGPDYFAFFKRLGTPFYYAWIENGKVAAVAAGVLRKVPFKTWYLCDLKVHPDFRGRRIPLKMLARTVLRHYLRCGRAYAISMDLQYGPNRVARLLANFRWLGFSVVGRLCLWSLTAVEMREVLPCLERHRGPVSFLSLAGVKDIVLRSTGRPLRILHAQFGPCADSAAGATIEEGAVHMFCAPENDELSKDLNALGIFPTSTATLISHQLQSQNWRWILTSDI